MKKATSKRRRRMSSYLSCMLISGNPSPQLSFPAPSLTYLKNIFIKFFQKNFLLGGIFLDLKEWGHFPSILRHSCNQVSVMGTILSVLDLVSPICDVVLVRRTFSSGKPQGVGILGWGGDGDGEISL